MYYIIYYYIRSCGIFTINGQKPAFGVRFGSYPAREMGDT